MTSFGLSGRLALFMVVATLIMQLGHGLYRFSVDVAEAKQQSIDDIDRLVTSLQPALAEALYQYNEPLSDKLLNVFSGSDSVQTVWLLDQDGTGLGIWARAGVDIEENAADEQYEVTWPLTYEQSYIGSLVILVSMSVVEQAAIDQTWNVILFSVMIGLFALLLLYFVAQKMVTRPVVSLSNTVSVIKSNAFTKEDVDVLDSVHAHYEIETLRLTIKGILYELAEHLGRNEQDMMSLKEFSSTLEEQVIKRTIELEQAKEKAEVASRAKTDFLNVITHELRTPLNGVLGFSGILKNRALAEKDKQLVQGIEESGQGLLVLLNDIIDFVALESKALDCQIFSVYDALSSAFNEQKSAAQQKNLEYSLEVDSSLTLQGDAKRLSVLTRQLLSNAIKFTDSGSVTLSCVRESSGHVLVSITDSGIGMDDSCYGTVSSEMFMQEAFTQAQQGLNRSNEGLGLGLAIVGRICKKWPAKIHFEKNTPQGTKVCVELSDVISEQ